AGTSTFAGINLPANIAITHALLLGWLTLTMMGATYQLGPVVLGGALLSERLARVQFVVHVTALAAFVWAVHQWHMVTMGAAGGVLVLSLLLYALNVGVAIRRGATWTLPRAYAAAAVL